MTWVLRTHRENTPAGNAEQRREIMHNFGDNDQIDGLFRLAVEAAANAWAMSDNEGKIGLVNSQAEKLFGYEREDLLGQPVEILLTKASRKGHPDIWQSFWGDTRARPFGIGRDLHAQRKVGAQFSVEISLNPIKTAKVQAVVRARRGAIDVASTPESRETFHVFSPCAVPEEQEHHVA